MPALVCCNSQQILIEKFEPNFINRNNLTNRFGVQRSVAIVASRNRCLEDTMLWTIFVILLVLWLLGIVSSYTLGGYIHLLLVIAVVVLILQLISGRRPAL
jgi:hypothetical protein